jgi:DNA gyrase subunit A
MLALVPDAATGRLVPRVMPVRDVLQHYIDHRHEVIVRRTQFDLEKALEREHILEGLKIAVDNIDEVIRIIRAASDTPVASTQLQARFKLSERQAEAILNMRLAKLTGLEIDKLEAELAEVRATIADLRGILESRPRRMQIMKDELAEVVAKYGDERRSEITSDEGEFTIEDLIAEEDMVVTISHTGYIKRTPVTTYRRQRRGGRGLSGQDLKDTDFIERLFIASTHDYIMIFTDDGRCFWLKVHEIPAAGRHTRGKPIVNLINVSPDTKIRSMVNVREFREDRYLLFCTRAGTVKKTALSEYGNVRSTGIKAIKIEQGDALIDVQITDGANDIVLATKHGLSIRFPESTVRDMGRDTTGVKGVELRPEDKVVSMVVVRRSDATLLVVTSNGMGKVTDMTEYRVQNRGGKGILTLNRTEKTGNVVAVMEVVPDEEIMLITKQGIIIRSAVGEVRNTGRNAQGVKLVNLDAKDVVCAVARVVVEKDEAGEGGEGAEGVDGLEGADGEEPLALGGDEEL